MEIFKPPPNLSFTSGNLGDQWRRWEQHFRVYFTAAELVKKEAKTRVAILLHCAGPEAQDIHSNFVLKEIGQRTITVCSRSSKSIIFCEPRKNEVFEQYKLWQRDQHEGGTIDQCVNDLRFYWGVASTGIKRKRTLETGLCSG